MLGIDFSDIATGGAKSWIPVLVLVAALIGAFSVGAVVNGWRLNAAHAEVLSEKDRQISDLMLKITTQNAAVDILHEKKVAADDRRKLAADMSKSVLEGIEAKAAKAAASTATDCKGVLREAWENAR